MYYSAQYHLSPRKRTFLSPSASVSIWMVQNYRLERRWPCHTLMARAKALRSRVSEHLYQNAQWILIISGYAPDSGGPQEQSFSSGSSRTGVAFFPKTSKNGHISVVVAPIGLKFCVRARFLVSRLLGPFPAQLAHLSYCELDLDYLDLLDFKLEQIRGHFC